MESKRDRSLRLLKSTLDFLTCPVCGSTLNIENDNSLKCENHHNYDISKKGVINLSGKGNDKIYNKELFENRKIILSENYYAPLIDSISNIILEYAHSESKTHLSVLDAGCGEGTFLSKIHENINQHMRTGAWVGLDLSKDGINLATDNSQDIMWIVDDLADIHVNSNSFDIVLNILSPANYGEFKKVLKSDGVIVKVIPSNGYLQELRALIDAPSDIKKDYDNTETLSYTSKEMNIIKHEKLDYTVRLTAQELDNFIKMTPMTKNKDILTQNKKGRELTIALEIIVGKSI